MTCFHCTLLRSRAAIDLGLLHEHGALGDRLVDEFLGLLRLLLGGFGQR